MRIFAVIFNRVFITIFSQNIDFLATHVICKSFRSLFIDIFVLRRVRKAKMNSPEIAPPKIHYITVGFIDKFSNGMQCDHRQRELNLNFRIYDDRLVKY